MVDQYNSKNELLELAMSSKWPQPTFMILPDNQYQCEVVQQIPQHGAAPLTITTVGEQNPTKKGAEKRAAAAMIAQLAAHTQQQHGPELESSPDYAIPQLPIHINYINHLQELNQAKGWMYPSYTRLLAVIAPETIRLCTFVTVTTATGVTCRSRSYLRTGATDAKQEAAARVLIALFVADCITMEELPPSLHEAATAATATEGLA